jgi:spore coat protein A, manganese oxidase
MTHTAGRYAASLALAIAVGWAAPADAKKKPPPICPKGQAQNAAVMFPPLGAPNTVPQTQVFPYPGQQAGSNACVVLATPLNPRTQPRFAYPLPIPRFLTPETRYGCQDAAGNAACPYDYYEVAYAPVTHSAVPNGHPTIPASALAPPGFGQQWLGLVAPGTATPLYTPAWGFGQVNSGGGPLGLATDQRANAPVPGAPFPVATYPSMSIKGTRGRPVQVKWVNLLPDQHLFCPDPTNSDSPCAIDRTIMGALHKDQPVSAFGSAQSPDNGVVPHLHGGEIPPDSDGFAELWFGNERTSGLYNAVPTLIDPPLTGPAGHAMPGSALVRPTANFDVYNYPMVQRASTLWFHDHALGKTRINVAAGPAGFFSIEDPNPALKPTLPDPGDCSAAGIAAGKCYDVPILLQDRAFNSDGTVNFPNGLNYAAIAPNTPLAPGFTPHVHPQWVGEYFGDVSVVNGVIYPFMNVEPRQYRFRFLDGSNARCYRMFLSHNATFTAIATEQGYLNAPAVTPTITICPGERVEAVVDFSRFKFGTTVVLNNSAGAPFPNGVTPTAKDVMHLMAFNVVPPAVPVKHVAIALKPGTVPPVPAVPAAIKSCDDPALGPPPEPCVREMVLNEVVDPFSLAPVRVQINASAFEGAITETPRRGRTEFWRIANTTVDAHPIHVHLVQFQIVSRQPFDAAGYAVAANLDTLGNAAYNDPVTLPSPAFVKQPLSPYLLNAPRAAEVFEAGFKDTVQTLPGEVTTIVATWDGKWNEKLPVRPTDPPAFQPVTAGPYVWHCHILDHEDNEMMRPSLVMP